MRLPKCFPGFLGLLLITIFLKQMMWTAFIPMWQFPDEQAHFAQIQNTAEQVFPESGKGTTSREIMISEEFLGTLRDGFGNNKFTYHPEYNIVYTEKKIGLYEENIKTLPRQYRTDYSGTPAEATGYPPFYYQLGTIFYHLVYEQDLIIRIFVVRLVNLALFGMFVVIALRFAQLIFPNQPLFILTLTILIAFQPMNSFVSAGVNNDLLFNLISLFLTYLVLNITKLGWKWKSVVISGIVLYLGILTKPQGMILPFLFLFPIVKDIWAGKHRWIHLVLWPSILIIAFRGLLINMLTGQQFLPDIKHISYMDSITVSGYLTYWKTTLYKFYRETYPWYWGTFRWLSLTYPRWVHRIINWLTVISVSGIFWYLVKNIFRIRPDHKPIIKIETFLFLIFTSLLYLGFLVTYDYLFFLSHGYSLGFQGRYFFPTLGAHMALLFAGLMVITPYRMRIVIATCIGLFMILLHVYAYWFVISSYYTVSSLSSFFLQASQYKPVFFKTPFLEMIVVIQFVSLIIFLWYYLRLGVNDE